MYKKFFLTLKNLSTPSKFGYGIPSLWRGCSLYLLIEIIFKLFKRENNFRKEEPKEILFTSARSAIAAVLKAYDIGKNDEVIVSSFTCDAVTHAILSTNATPVYVDINSDLSMNEASVNKAINLKTKAVLVQNTFGRIGLSKDFIKSLLNTNILMIEDNCLSIGSRYKNIPLGQICPISIWSLEVSKSITLGWGGVLQVNDEELFKKIENYSKTFIRINLLSDLQRIIQLFITLFLLRFPTPVSFTFWYFFYGFRIFRKSSEENVILKKEIKLMGKLSQNLYFLLKPRFNKIFIKANQNYKFVELVANDLGIPKVIDSKKNEFIVSPRFSFYADPKNHKKIFKLAKNSRIEITKWFFNSPPKYFYENCKKEENYNVREISKKIFNIPIYWTFNKNEIHKIADFLKSISHLISK